MSRDKFKGDGLGIVSGQLCISVKFPREIDSLLRSLPNTTISEFVRSAVLKELVQQGLIEENKIEKYLEITNRKNTKGK